MKMIRLMVLMSVLVSVNLEPSQAATPRRRVVRPVPRPAPRRVVVRPPAAARRVVIGGVAYMVHAGVYYRLERNGYVVVKAPVVRVLPRHHRVVVVRGKVYYLADGVYYRTSPGGYVVVEKPVEAVEVAPAPVVAPAASSQTRTLYVPKRTGEGFVAVTLKKLDGGYLGPQGEFYPTMPAVALLTEMYGIPEELRQVRSDTFFIHVPNKDGASFTRVALKRHERGFLGPQGEFYPLMPSVARLTEMYGASGEPAPTEAADVTIQVPKKSGEGVVEVELKKHADGYVGPQGELYPELPSAEQLAEMYGGD